MARSTEVERLSPLAPVYRSGPHGNFEDGVGVALSEDRDPAVLEEETQALRDALRGAGRPMLDPTTPGASTWLAGEMREGDVYLLNPL